MASIRLNWPGLTVILQHYRGYGCHCCGKCMRLWSCVCVCDGNERKL